MTPEYEGTEIKQAPLTILQLLARRVEDNEENKVLVRDMMEETELSRGSIYNYLDNTLAPLDLAGITGTKSTPGAAADAKYWGITREGYNWLQDLSPNDLAPVEASGEAVEQAERAVEIANDTRATVERIDDQIDTLKEEISKTRADTDSEIGSVSDNIDRLENNLNKLHKQVNENRATATEPNQELAREIRRLDKDIERLYADLWTLDTDLRGNPDDDSDPGAVGANQRNIEAVKEAHEAQHRRIRILTAIATGALILGIIAVAVALI